MDFFYKMSKTIVFIAAYTIIMIMTIHYHVESKNFLIAIMLGLSNIILLFGIFFICVKFQEIETHLEHFPKDNLNINDFSNSKTLKTILSFFSKRDFFKFIFNFEFEKNIYQYSNNNPHLELFKNYITKIVKNVFLNLLNIISLFINEEYKRNFVDMILRLSFVSIFLASIINNKLKLSEEISSNQNIIWILFAFSIVLFLSFVSLKNFKTYIALKTFITIYGFLTAIIFLVKTFIYDIQYPLLYVDPVAIIITVCLMYFIYYLEYMILNSIILLIIYIGMKNLGIYEIITFDSIISSPFFYIFFPLIVSIPSIFLFLFIFITAIAIYFMVLVLMGLISIYKLVDYFDIVSNKINNTKIMIKKTFESLYSLLEVDHDFEHKFILKKNILSSIFLLIIIFLILFFKDFTISYERIHFVNNNGYCKNLQADDKILKDNAKIILDIEKSSMQQCAEKRYIYHKCNM